ncbi:phage tail sheath C-terminal domain-containing protein, partial [Paraburkholderia xenovorans]|uniref:phage tail sheath family protein n=1 Tax=Paraburkholderia xenovorans TaxID=36873 RepID=UPI0038B8185C
SVVAGIYCMVDRTRGVWKAPANVAIPSNYVPVTYVTDDLQGTYNTGKAINMIRAVDSRGPVVWGARTLSDTTDWRYVPVRRLFDSAERDISTSMQTMMFEPNNQPTWEKVRTAITNYLHNLWRNGALAGATETDAYFVAIGENVTMTAQDIADGKMIAQVGMAAVRPAEFIVLQFTQNMTQA